MKSVAVLQARTSSSRLPGKVLLPIGGFPMAVLGALRARNTGRPVILATSLESSDDVLVQAALEHSIKCFRGSLSSPLERIVESLSEYPDETVVFRLTGDNVFPDGQLLDELQQEFIGSQLSYLCCNGAQSGLPHGLSAEVVWLRDLRWALSVAVTSFDHEHVTPLIRKRYGDKYFQRYLTVGWGAGRCTVDCLDDYLRVQRLFAGVANSVEVGWKYLCESLMADPESPQIKRPADKLVLGTAQLGLPYGVCNSSGMPVLTEGKKIVRSAIRHGVAYIDTARAYGSSEEVVGTALSEGWVGRVKVITKLSPLSEINEVIDGAGLECAVRASVFESCQKLGVPSLDVLMLHRAAHLHAWNGRVWAELQRLVEAGVITTLGVSVQTPDELAMAFRYSSVLYIQMPLNLLDWRWVSLRQEIDSARATRDLKIHVRSALLQGLLTSENHGLWRSAHVDDSVGIMYQLNDWRERFSRIDLVDLCLAYVRGLPWVDGVCVGMETVEQLVENAKLFQRPPLKCSEIDIVDRERPVVDMRTLNPATWGAYE